MLLTSLPSKDVGLANAGIVYARPGSSAALRLLHDVAWRVLYVYIITVAWRVLPHRSIHYLPLRYYPLLTTRRVQLFQNHPEIVRHMFPWSRDPPYANSDDQVLLVTW